MKQTMRCIGISKNVQGDIIAILDGSGTEVVNYTYNAWGAHKTYGTLKDTLGKDNLSLIKEYYSQL